MESTLPCNHRSIVEALTSTMKVFFSIVLFAIADADCCFVYVNVGCQGRTSDGGVFANTHFRKMLDDYALNLPSARSLSEGSVPSPYVFVAVDAFSLHTNIMKPFAGLHEKGSEERVLITA
ncbi:hypothetical protein JTB14_036313 [Gonioctena quinquepunctata]|nr:hypothetical protein JTB14_036313 [Gonioctena quinquepunctata]